jgi:carbonic anhydrase
VALKAPAYGCPGPIPAAGEKSSMKTGTVRKLVTWYVLKQTVAVSPEQVVALAKLYPMNAHPIEPVNGRQIPETE